MYTLSWVPRKWLKLNSGFFAEVTNTVISFDQMINNELQNRHVKFGNSTSLGRVVHDYNCRIMASP